MPPSNFHLKIIILIAFVVLQFYIVSLFWLNDKEFTTNQEQKNILYWTKLFNHEDLYLGLGNISKNCPVKNCFATTRKSSMDVDKFDAILFHGAEYDFQTHGVPKSRSPNQIYVFVDRESPAFWPIKDDFIDFFNWTMTYRKDSDIEWSYGYFEETNEPQNVPSVSEVEKKTRKIAWFVSNCHAVSKREALAEKIQKYIPVDVYGRCGNYTCPRDNESKCFDLLDKKYKFYLSFENSVCYDYVTEKLFKVLKRNVVPIVYGGANYEVSAPPHSVINVANYDTVEDLVNFIKRLDANITEYMEYFQWKRKYIAKSRLAADMLCQLCKKLNEPLKTQIYGNIRRWWQGDNLEKCEKSPELFQ